ncbi:UPF0223 family protein [Staphylococcus intermedius]|uniref:Cytosolic protein n=1 Tax=Staphylococcus intermedius NCTC 11048 TaxID=1141106 RepID=A0A380GA78_STAIN|nr:UPF0223 family protein [Staphylococcus intermedius]PCF65220.1 hypothetical protein B5C04_03985 [Staphylococcus intermedius]PCF80831.1 hypothetical protein B4W74_04000 [Staphylococcus intermedius]PCF82180.1 hypothetical protein B4W70_03980 [Staphylococcus intermedius]PCF87442.1 hypothetical protein B4W76_03370 [Staphylococcus intermedius]PCF88516.1 hypothetical protein B4W75_07025 [Staphylococcus intermedius]
MEYTYPIDVDWSQEEMVAVISFFNAIEAYYESQVERELLMIRYREFKQVVPGKADEKNMFNDFKQQSGYDSYQVVKQAKQNPDQKTLKNS